MAFNAASLNDYVDVASRLQLAYERWPELRLVEDPPTIVHLDNRSFIQVTVTAHRTPDDPVPCRASAWEPFPGLTPYTKNSEMMNCATSATGRCLGLMGIGSKKSLASGDEVRIRQHEDNYPRELIESVKSEGRPSPAQIKVLKELIAQKGIEYDGDISLMTRTFASKMIDEWKRLPNKDRRSA